MIVFKLIRIKYINVYQYFHINGQNFAQFVELLSDQVSAWLAACFIAS